MPVITPPLITPAPVPAITRPALQPVGKDFTWGELGLDDRLFGQPGDRAALVNAVDQSLKYLKTAPRAYPVLGISRDRTEKSLRRFRQLVLSKKTTIELQTAVQKEFQLYESSGKDGTGTVSFTGYYEPVHAASRQPTATYRYPLYKAPAQLSAWKSPQPTRLDLEGKDGRQARKGKLKGLELVYLNDRLQAFLIQVQGSSRLQLTDGTTMSVGFAGATNYPYSSVGKELVKDGKFTLEELTLPKVVDYFKQNPADLDVYLPRNQRFVFLRDTQGTAAIGSLNVPVTGERSIATDKKIMPPGALALIQTQLPDRNLNSQPVSRFVLDQDTGSAIVGPGRVDLFMGTGDAAGAKAGLVNTPGKLYYLFLK